MSDNPYGFFDNKPDDTSVYIGTGGTNDGKAQPPYQGPGASGAWSGNGVDANWWGVADSYVDKALDSYSKSAFSDSVDKGLSSAKQTTDKLATAANNWLGYASDPSNLQNALVMVTVIVVVLGVVYVIATFAPAIRGLAR